jgi:hypothetical protein
MLGVAELQKSLHTTDLAVARRLCFSATAWFRTMMEQLRAMSSPTRADLEAAARAFFAELRSNTDRHREFPDGECSMAVAHNVHFSEERIGELDRQLVTKGYDGEIRLAATELLASLGVTALISTRSREWRPSNSPPAPSASS